MIKIGNKHYVININKYTYRTYIVVSIDDWKNNKDKGQIRVGDGLYKSALDEFSKGEGITIRKAVEDFLERQAEEYSRDINNEIELKNLIKELKKYNYFEI